MSVQDEIKRITAPDIRARKGGDPIVSLTSYHAHTAGLVDRHCDFILVGDSLGMVMHGHGDDRAGDARDDDPAGAGGDARLEARAGRRRHAVRLLRGLARAGFSQRRARHEGNRLRRDQARGRRAHGRDHRVPEPARHAGDGPCRPDPAGDQHARLVQGAGTARGGMGWESKPMPGRSPMPAPSPSCWRGWPSRSPRASPNRSRSRRSASGRARPATARFWCWRTCSGSRRGRRNSSSAMRNSAPAIEEAVGAYAAEVRSRAFPAEANVYHLAKSRPA